MIGVEANLADIEVLRPVDVSYRDGDEFDLPVHVRQLTRLSSLAVSRYIGQNPTADDYVVIGGAGARPGSPSCRQAKRWHCISDGTVAQNRGRWRDPVGSDGPGSVRCCRRQRPPGCIAEAG